MKSFSERWGPEGRSLWGRANFDPGTLMVGSLVASAVGGAATAAGTLAGGDYAAQAGQMQKTAAYAQASEQDAEALQTDQNASQAFASGQRQALDTSDRTRLAISSSVARAGASGVDAGVGSPLENVGALAQRGSYHALMDMFNGESTSTGLLNQGAATRYGATITRYGGDEAALEGEEKQSASKLAAIGTLAGTAGSMASSYGKFAFPASTTKGGF